MRFSILRMGRSMGLNCHCPSSSIGAVALQVACHWGSSAGTHVDQQNVVLNMTLIPEPSSALLGALGVASLLMRRRR